MNIDLSPYVGKRICVALSGGKDSMALLHYLKAHGERYGILLSALNCDHAIRGEDSIKDSEFVRQYCAVNDIPCIFFRWEGDRFCDEGAARLWRLGCYQTVISQGQADCIATAHHMNDNAETVLFNLARGTSLNGLTGITDENSFKIIRPMIGCTGEEIAEYVAQNNIPFVTDATNFTEAYTRNKIRLNVLPALQKAVPGAVKNIYRFSRLAAEDEEYFGRQVNLVLKERKDGYLILPCEEKVIFKRAAHKIIAGLYGKKDYTSDQLDRLFKLQSAQNGKKFFFLGLIAVKEEGGVAFYADKISVNQTEEASFFDIYNCANVQLFNGVWVVAADENVANAALSSLEEGERSGVKLLKFDLDKIPAEAVIRFKRQGDRFQKFGGGAKSLGDYLTDKKVPQVKRNRLPLVCCGKEALIVGGVEISDRVKIDESTRRIGVFACANQFD